MQSLNINALLEETFGHMDFFTSKDIFNLLTKLYPDVSNKTIAWKINQLKKDKTIFQVGRGVYSMFFMPEFEPIISLKSRRIYKKIEKETDQKVIIWDTSTLDKLSQKNSNKLIIFILASKLDLEMLFSLLQQLSKPIFLNPDSEITNRYILPQEEVVILLPCISQMPTVLQNDFFTPTIEATLVNIWIDFEQYFKPLGYDIKTLFQMSFKNYRINRSKLLRYAGRRDKRDAIEKFINTINS